MVLDVLWDQGLIICGKGIVGRKTGITPQQAPMAVNRKMEKIKSV